MSVDVNTVDLNSNGSYIVAGTIGSIETNKIVVFEKCCHTPLLEFDIDNVVEAVSISSDGKYIVGGGWDGEVYAFVNNHLDKSDNEEDEGEKKSPDQFTIPGYNVIALVAIIGLISIIWWKKTNN
jgi:WD40 repeat protein